MKKNNNQPTNNNNKRTFTGKRNFNNDYSKPESLVQPLDYFSRNSNIEYNVLTLLKKRDT